MRGDWIYDWVRVEMEYRAGPPPAVRRPREPRPAPRHWAALRAGLFPGGRAEVQHGSPAAGC
ncbi:hypothetical protein QRX60_37535 [Amycolatopsis mongoliensis]|uniref:Uncharacterized protein n=1 Tax=Amycolatopsis mongoliensis TaxID=715475 RepID=A0A9Y2NCL0_9PSEU|nr:hypothetical protein [Amycolatopsis sp. 4-36]WIX99716.1 hypothetical protein QRX60_37535 [Amycolatopsis sp. 4-36]